MSNWTSKVFNTNVKYCIQLHIKVDILIQFHIKMDIVDYILQKSIKIEVIQHIMFLNACIIANINWIPLNTIQELIFF